MWIYNRYGHYAPVVDKKDGNFIIIRARRADDLDALRTHLMPCLGPNEFDAARDYNVRARILKTEFVKGMTDMALDVDYTSYKNMIHHTQPARYSVYTKIWDATLGLSDCTPAEKHKSIYGRSFRLPTMDELDMSYDRYTGEVNEEVMEDVKPFDHMNNDFKDPRDYDFADDRDDKVMEDSKNAEIASIFKMNIKTKHTCDDNCKYRRVAGGLWKCTVELAKDKERKKFAKGKK